MPEVDAARGLDRTGRAQAGRLHDAFSGYRIDRIVSSPLVRCVETVVPLARRLGLEVELRAELEPGASKRRVLRLLRDLPDDALVCTHREVFETLFGDELTFEKGAAWVVEPRGRGFGPVAYLPAPALRRSRRAAVLVPGCL